MQYYTYRSFGIILFLTFCLGLHAQKPTICVVSAAVPLVHSEGLAEQIGDIDLQCTGTPGAVVSGNVNVFLPVAITNQINAGGYSVDASLSIDTGTGIVPSGVSGLVTNQSISFNGFQFTFPSSGAVTLVIDDVRANVNQLGLQQTMPITAYIGGTLPLQTGNNPVDVAFPQVGLLATSLDSGVTCTGSPTPASINLGSLFAAKTIEQTTRVTEGFVGSFQPKNSTSGTGTRFLLSYSSVPAGAAIYVPDAVAGSDAILPTSGGDLGTPAAVGQYAQGSQTLLLVRVLGTDATGLGGTLATLPAPNASGVLVLNGANPVPLTNGAGYAVYEVAAASPSATENAQIPNFFAVAANSPPAMANGTLSLAPVSTVASASTTAPIPRFVAVTPPSDCAAVGDCNASYYPLLTATATPLQATVVAGTKSVAMGNITINNTKGGVLDWSATVTYTNGSNWLFFTQSFGNEGALIQAFVNPSALTPGTYQASVLIDAGPIAGSQSFPVTLTVTAAAPALTITSVTDAADFHPGPVAPGSLATIWGANLAGQNVSVAFNGMTAKPLYTGATQINLQIPPALSGQSSAQMVVTVDGVSSAPFTVALTAVAPAIFTPGVLNQDNTLNSTANPAPLGTVLQIFLTGMPDSGAVATVTIQNRNLVPLYAGAAPGLLGLEQVNVAVPADLQGVASSLTICVTGAGNQPYCSQPESIALKP
ncbi:MAG: IPT/TIG domain-containing protein [Bryobacteraceae bacterium]|jgi:uncharacterized protein (TIGR03437 family)